MRLKSKLVIIPKEIETQELINQIQKELANDNMLVVSKKKIELTS